MLKLILLFLIIIFIYAIIKEKNREDFSNIKYSNGYFIYDDENKRLYQDYINESNSLQAPLIKYNICNKGYNLM